VDKTHFITEWMQSEAKVTLITRPRRFGKTVMANMIAAFFSKGRDAEVDLLFERYLENDIAPKMVTRDDLVQLVKNQGQEAVGAAVVKIPDEDVRPALMLMVMIYQKSDEINRELFRRDQKRIAELEEELEKARAELHQLKQEQ